MLDIIAIQEQLLQLIVIIYVQLDIIDLSILMQNVLKQILIEQPVLTIHVSKKNVVNSLSDVQKIQLDLLQGLHQNQNVQIVLLDFIAQQGLTHKNHAIEVFIVLKVVLKKLFLDQKVQQIVQLNNMNQLTAQNVEKAIYAIRKVLQIKMISYAHQDIIVR